MSWGGDAGTCFWEDPTKDVVFVGMIQRMARAGMDAAEIPDAAIQAMVAEQARRFLEDAPMTVAAAATVILDGVKAEQWRIHVGEDAHRIDALVRADPENAYELRFFQRLAEAASWQLNGIAGNRES